MGMVKHSQILKIASLQCLYNIFKKKLDEIDFLHADRHQSFYKLALFSSMEVAGHVQSTQNRKLLLL